MMIRSQKPNMLTAGDTVSLVSLSSPVSQEIVQRSAEYLNSLGFKVILAENIYSRQGYMAGSPQERVEDLHAMFGNKEVKAIFCAYGGTSANQLLPLIDYDLISSNNKVFMALSDPSVLAVAIYAKTGIVTFHGPTGYNFARKMTPYTERYFLRSFTSVEPLGSVEELSEWIIIKEGTTQGKVVGCNLTLLQSLVGTPYEPDWAGKILFWEDLFLEYHAIDLIINHLAMTGILDKIEGMIVGKLVGCEEKEYESNETFEQLMSRLFSRYKFPIVCNVDLGHTDDKITIPLGIEVKLDLHKEKKRIVFLESAVSS